MPDYSRFRDAADTGIRTLAASLRAVLEAEEEVELAKDAKTQRLAQQRYNDAMLNLQQRRVALGENQLVEDERAAKVRESNEAERIKILQATEDAKTKKLEVDKSNQEALDALGTTWDGEVDLYYEDREKYRAETDPEEKAKLRAAILRRGGWLESNAERIKRSFPAHARFLESDEEAKKAKDEKDATDAELDRKRKAIEASTVLTDEQKTKALEYLDIDPEYNFLEALDEQTKASAKTAAETAEETKKQAAIDESRKKKHELLDDHKDAIVAQHGEQVWEGLKTEVEIADNPDTINVLKYLEPPKPDKDDEDDPNIIEIAGGITDEPIRQTLTRISANSIFTTPEKKAEWAQQITNEIGLGNRGVVLRMFGDKIRDITKTTDKFIAARLPIAKQLVNIRSGIFELGDMNVSTGRILSHYVEGMSLADWRAALSETAIEFTGLEDLDEDQRRKATEIATQINASLALLLQKVSGAAVHESEFERWRAMLPALFKSEEINIGTIDGFLNVMRQDQEASYSEWTHPDIAKEMIEEEGWGAIKTTEDLRTERAQQWADLSDDGKQNAAAHAIDTTASRAAAIEKIVGFYSITREQATEILDAFDNLTDEQKQQIRDRVEQLKSGEQN